MVSLTFLNTFHQVGFCLIVCNLLVIVTFIYRVLRRKETDKSPQDVTSTNSPIRSTSIPGTHFTTVDLDDLEEPVTSTRVDVLDISRGTVSAGVSSSHHKNN